DDGMRNLSRRCACPAASHLDATSGKCVPDTAPVAAPVTKSLDDRAPSPPETKAANIRCDGGSVRDGGCACPAGFKLRPAGDNSGGGACVRTNAENCQGGELTASGTCLCNGQVVMSGETYLMEYANGKCLPKRCPVETTFREGRCVEASAVTATPAAEPEAKEKPASRRETSDEEEPRRRCAHGMVRTRAGCVEARRRTYGKYDNARRYYRMYDYPGYAIGMPPY
ncbi:hypothetical protein, partial [Bradyrhizobium sp.]|uniref:hypothetical protein n=1 Tax=Bradyrhizobium sp. TaxID=376 RepID=UPI0025BEB54F